MIRNKEFQTTPFGEVLIEGDNGTKQLAPEDRIFMGLFLSVVRELWPWSLPPLYKKFEKIKFNTAIYEYRIVRHWIKCNLGNYDHILDIDQLGNLHLEIVTCPLRGGDCPMEGDHKTENCVCKPKFNSQLSNRELEVMNLYYNGLDTEKISDRLLISQNTVNTHRKNSLKRVDVHSLSEFFHYARTKNLFE
ncbi:LuxR family transcriptional regulator [Mariniphaga sediminis]|uniref:LuxR family transcriptional regulator n=1 Tax=Mariniphaga sediminis TaxID=1628158 RepID=UPI00356317B8